MSRAVIFGEQLYLENNQFDKQLYLKNNNLQKFITSLNFTYFAFFLLRLIYFITIDLNTVLLLIQL